MVIDEDNIRKSVLKLAVPSVMEQALVMVVGVVSTIFVGHLGKQAISAVGLINTLTAFILVIFTALSTSCTVLVARLIGEGGFKQAKDTVKQSTIIAIFVAILISIICYIFTVSIINLFFGNAEWEVKRLAGLYFRITLFTVPLTLVNLMISSSLRGAGDTRTPMFIAIIVNIINIALGIILIFGVNLAFLRIKGMGVAGAAWAVAISRGAGGLLSIAVLLLPGNLIRLRLFEKFKFDFSLIKRTLNVGVPAAMEQVIMQGGFLVMQMVIAGMGTTAMAVFQIGMSINSICFVPGYGVGIAATTMVGQGLGAKRPDLSEKCGWNSLKIALVITTVLTVLVFIFAGDLLRIYTNDAEVIKVGITAIRIFSISQPFLAVVVVFSCSLRGAGDIMYVVITTLVGTWAFRILITVLLNTFLGMGITGVWIAYCADFFIRSVMYFIRFRRGNWKLLRV